MEGEIIQADPSDDEDSPTCVFAGPSKLKVGLGSDWLEVARTGSTKNWLAFTLCPLVKDDLLEVG